MLSALSVENKIKHFGWFASLIWSKRMRGERVEVGEREFIYVSTLFPLNYFYFNLVDASKTIWARCALVTVSGGSLSNEPYTTHRVIKNRWMNWNIVWASEYTLKTRYHTFIEMRMRGWIQMNSSGSTHSSIGYTSSLLIFNRLVFPLHAVYLAVELSIYLL